jgi:hypothetical protein
MTTRVLPTASSFDGSLFYRSTFTGVWSAANE